jgi:DNA-binding CsgD family transcriptional regulator
MGDSRCSARRSTLSSGRQLRTPPSPSSHARRHRGPDRATVSGRASQGRPPCQRWASSVNRVGRGRGSVLDPAVVDELVGRRRQGGNPLEHLAEREREVLALMAEGRSNDAIAERLYVTDHTVEKLVKNILGTLQLPRPQTTTRACSPSSPTSTRNSHKPRHRRSADKQHADPHLRDRPAGRGRPCINARQVTSYLMCVTPGASTTWAC